jgi:hypothetical protein
MLEAIVRELTAALGPPSFRLGPEAFGDGTVLVFWQYRRGEVCVSYRPEAATVVVNPARCLNGCLLNCECGERFPVGGAVEGLAGLGERVAAAAALHGVGNG